MHTVRDHTISMLIGQQEKTKLRDRESLRLETVSSMMNRSGVQ